MRFPATTNSGKRKTSRWRCSTACLMENTPSRSFAGIAASRKRKLAKRTGLNATYLSQIETRKRGGSTRVYRLLAVALNVDIGDLIE